MLVQVYRICVRRLFLYMPETPRFRFLPAEAGRRWLQVRRTTVDWNCWRLCRLWRPTGCRKRHVQWTRWTAVLMMCRTRPTPTEVVLRRPTHRPSDTWRCSVSGRNARRMFPRRKEMDRLPQSCWVLYEILLRKAAMVQCVEHCRADLQTVKWGSDRCHVHGGRKKSLATLCCICTTLILRCTTASQNYTSFRRVWILFTVTISLIGPSVHCKTLVKDICITPFYECTHL